MTITRVRFANLPKVVHEDAEINIAKINKEH